MKPRHTILFAAIIALPVASGGDRPQPAPESAPTFSQGMVLNVDASGKFVQTPSRTADLRAALGEAISTSAEGLIVEKSPLPGGGIMVDLQGRFQNAMVVEKDADGNLAAPCVTGEVE